MATVSRPTAPRQHKLELAVSIDGTAYGLTELPIDSSIGSKAFRFAKRTADDAVYDVHLDGFGLQCQCQGFLRWGHCKHCETLMALGQMFHCRPPAPQVIKAERTGARLETCPRCAGNGESEDGQGCQECCGEGYVPVGTLDTMPSAPTVPPDDLPF